MTKDNKTICPICGKPLVNDGMRNYRNNQRVCYDCAMRIDESRKNNSTGHIESEPEMVDVKNVNGQDFSEATLSNGKWTGVKPSEKSIDDEIREALTWDEKSRGYSITFDQMKAYVKQSEKTFESAITMAYREAYESGYRESVRLHKTWNNHIYQKAQAEIEDLTTRMAGYKKNNELLLSEHIADLRAISELEKQIEKSNSLRDEAIDKYSSITDKYCNLVEQSIEMRYNVDSLEKELKLYKGLSI